MQLECFCFRSNDAFQWNVSYCVHICRFIRPKRTFWLTVIQCERFEAIPLGGLREILDVSREIGRCNASICVSGGVETNEYRVQSHVN